MIKYEYIKLKPHEKSPLTSFDDTFKRNEVDTYSDLAILIEEPYVVLDIDNVDYFNVLCEIIKDKNIKTRIMKTTRGGHFWFKTSTPLTNSVDVNTPITLKTDIRSWGKKSMSVVKRDGVWREWIKEDENIDELPFWLTPIKIKKDLYGMKDGDGRDPALFSFIYPLISLKFNKEQIKDIFEIINYYVFEDPLKPQEIDKMFEGNDIFDKKELHFFQGRRFMHNNFVDWMIDSYCFKSYGKQVYLYDEGLYKKDDDKIYMKMIEQLPELTRNNMSEAYENLRLKITGQESNIDPLKVNVLNGIYDLKDKVFIEHSPYIFSINQINAAYNPSAYCKEVDDMFESVTQGDKSIRLLLEEMIGYMLIGDCRFQKAFVLLGKGANGKSKFLEMIENFIGKNNCSSLALEDLSERFRTAELVGKIANIGDDSGGDLLKNTQIFKKVVTGEGITVERKHENPFTFFNTSKVVFAANSLPPSTDKSEGFFRRIVIIPFRATFKPGMEGYDPNIIDKVTTNEARSYLLNIAISSAKKILSQNRLDIPNEVSNLVESYEIDNNNVLQWIQQYGEEILGKTMDALYTDYCLYCNTTNSLPIKISKFNYELMKAKPGYELDFETDIRGAKKYIWKLKETVI